MQKKNEKDIGLNTLGGRMVIAGLTSMGLTATVGVPIWLTAVPVLVVLVGVAICSRSFWWRR